MADEIQEGRLYSKFERYGEFVVCQKSFLSLDLFEGLSSEELDKESGLLFTQLSNILHEYQEQSYLLDPFLEELVVPVAECLKNYAKTVLANRTKKSSATRVLRVTLLLHCYVKFRGYKTIIRFFPHEIADLSIALDFLLLPQSLVYNPSQWALRYLSLIWLSLVCMLPFDLSQFDDADHIGYTASTIENTAKSFLGMAGLEREGAALLLSRLYMRQDTASRFISFIEWSYGRLREQSDVFTSIGLLQVLSEVVKAGPVEQIKSNLAQLSSIASIIDKTEGLSGNTTIRKYKTKLVSRIALRVLPAPLNARIKGRVLAGNDENSQSSASEEDVDIPESVEPVLEQLFEALQDKDTIVRWSAAKAIARISERLSAEFADQILETVMGLFAIHSIAAASIYNLPAIAESTWHGASLACAEMARRGLVASTRLPELIEWLSKALYFDIRKGAHSIGSNVRDAASYVLWALARTQDPSALVPHAVDLAQRLTAVALFDREIHIRRAASAAYQEHVGRNSLFPHGIDVLAKTDFYAVSIKRNAFLTAAPQVAVHSAYRNFLFNHILDVVMRHWDSTMRELGSQSLRSICLVDLPVLGPQACSKITRLLESADITDLHGGLLALCEVANAYRLESIDSEDVMRGLFRLLAYIPFSVIIESRNAIVIAASCRLISITLTFSEVQLGNGSSVPHWRRIVDHGLKSKSTPVQEAAAEAMSSLSKFVDCSALLKSGSPVVQQSLGIVLGALDYNVYNNSLQQALECLLDCAKPTSQFKLNIEARRNCYLALPRILSSTVHGLSKYMSSDLVNSLYETLLGGLDDYSTDERGDVGSWIRIACIRGLASFSELLISNGHSIQPFEAYLPPLQYRRAIAGILKQGVERLDNVRQEAGASFMRLFDLELLSIENSSRWELPGSTLLKELFQGERIGWNEGEWLFPKAVRLLDVKEYRRPVLSGLVIGLGSKTEGTQRPLAASLASYVRSLGTVDNDAGYDANSLVTDLLDHLTTHIMSNGIVIPVLKTLNILLEAGSLAVLSSDSRGIDSFRKILSIVTRNLSRLKSVSRILESMKLVINLLSFESLFGTCTSSLPNLLGHQFPSVRRDTAEHLYMALQITNLKIDTDNIEEVLLETEWSSSNVDVYSEATARIVSMFSVVE